MAKKKEIKSHVKLSREVPSSIEAEQALLSSILINNELFKDIINHIYSPDFFYLEKHKVVYQCMIDLHNEGKQLNPINVLEELKKNDLESKLNEEEIYEFMESQFLGSTWDTYAKIIKEKFLFRRVIQECSEIIEESLHEKKLTAVIDHLFSNFNLISQAISSTKEEYNLQNKLIDFKNDIVSKIESGSFKPNIVHSGFQKLDKKVGGGLYPGSYNILGARASVGKTSFALNLMRNMAMEGKNILFFSLEQPVEQIIARFLSMTMEVSFTSAMSGDLAPLEDMYGDQVGEVINHAIETIGNYADRINIIDNSKLDINDMKNITRRYVKEKGVEVVFIDYLQFIKSAVRDTKLRETTDISRSLKELASEEKVSLFVLSQLSRSIEQYDRKDKSPKLSDLRDSGALEQDADVVMFLYPAEDQTAGKPGEAALTDYLSNPEARINVSIAKNRNGATGIVPFIFFKSRFTFEETDSNW